MFSHWTPDRKQHNCMPPRAAHCAPGIAHGRNNCLGSVAQCLINGIPGLRPESCWNDCLAKEDSIRPCVPSHVAYEVERRGNRPFEALGQWTHIRKSGTETVRPRCICQHKVERG